jgi:hypothetical protein
MGNKRITELQLISDIVAGLNFPSDDGIQSYRATAQQIYDYILATGNVLRPHLAVGALGRCSVMATQTTTLNPIDLDTYDIIPVNASSGGFTVTLPTAVGIGGRKVKIMRVDQTLANAVTIATTSAQTINGVTTRKLMTQYEEFTLVSDNTNWLIDSHTYPKEWVAYTPTGSWTANSPVYTGFWKREGDSAFFQTKVTCGGANTSASLTMSIPSGLTMNTGKLVSSGSASIGHGTIRDVGLVHYTVICSYSTSTTIAVFNVDDGVSGVNRYSQLTAVTQAVPFTSGVNDVCELWLGPVPITNWEG